MVEAAVVVLALELEQVGQEVRGCVLQLMG